MAAHSSQDEPIADDERGSLRFAEVLAKDNQSTPAIAAAFNDFDPTQPGQRERDVYGYHNAVKRSLDQWLQHVVDVIWSGCQPAIKHVFLAHAVSKGFYHELDRRILIHAIETSSGLIQHTLARYCVIILFLLEGDHDSHAAQTCFENGADEILERLLFSLRIRVPAQRTIREETEINLLVWALLELSGGETVSRYFDFDVGHSAKDNADLFAMLFDISGARRFGSYDPQQMCITLLKCPVFAQTTIHLECLVYWTTELMDAIHLGFPEGYLNLPLEVLSRFSFCQVKLFRAYRDDLYNVFPAFCEPEYSMPLFLMWNTTIAEGPVDFSHQSDILLRWAKSDDGCNQYRQWAEDVQNCRCAHQLALKLVFLMIYRRVVPDHLDDSYRPINGSFLADQAAFFDGRSLGNSGKVAERMVLAMMRVLCFLGDRYMDLVGFLEIAFDGKPPLLHPLDGFSDRFWFRRITGPEDESARAALPTILTPELGVDDTQEWTLVAEPEELAFPELRLGEDPSANYLFI